MKMKTVNQKQLNVIVNLETLNIIAKKMLNSKVYTPKEQNKKNQYSIFYDKGNNLGYNFNYDTFSRIRNGEELEDLLNEKKIIAMSEYTGIDVGIFTGKITLIKEENLYKKFERLHEVRLLQKDLRAIVKDINPTQEERTIDENQKEEDARINFVDIEEIEQINIIIAQFSQILTKSDMNTEDGFIRGLMKLNKEDVTFMNAMVHMALCNFILEEIEIGVSREIEKDVLSLWDSIYEKKLDNINWLQVKQFIIRNSVQKGKIESVLELLNDISIEELKKVDKKKLKNFKNALNNAKKKVILVIEE